MKIFLVFIALIFSLSSFASKNYQLQNIIGNWVATRYPDAFVALQISYNGEGEAPTLHYCEVFTLKMTGYCDEIRNYHGEVSYDLKNETLLVKETYPSVDLPYKLQVHPLKNNVMIRVRAEDELYFYKVNWL